MKFIVGAYASAPSNIDCSVKDEEQFYSLLTENNKLIGGFEIPFYGDDINKFGTEFILKYLKPYWKNVLTCVPLSFLTLKKYPKFGLASTDETSRVFAIEKHRQALEKLQYISNRIGSNSFYSIHVASGPTSTKLNKLNAQYPFLKSLEEICSWDWQGSRVLVEHCDTFHNNSYQKGFLDLNTEIDVIEEIKKKFDVGISLNWARSAIEGKDVNTVFKHINKVLDKNLLEGFLFSGTSKINDILYGKWQDNHMPFGNVYNVKYFEENSLLNYENIKKTLDLLVNADIKYLGIKLLTLPLNKMDIKRRIGINKDALYILNKMLLEYKKDNFNTIFD